MRHLSRNKSLQRGVINLNEILSTTGSTEQQMTPTRAAGGDDFSDLLWDASEHAYLTGILNTNSFGPSDQGPGQPGTPWHSSSHQTSVQVWQRAKWNYYKHVFGFEFELEVHWWILYFSKLCRPQKNYELCIKTIKWWTMLYSQIYSFRPCCTHQAGYKAFRKISLHWRLKSVIGYPSRMTIFEPNMWISGA